MSSTPSAVRTVLIPLLVPVVTLAVTATLAAGAMSSARAAAPAAGLAASPLTRAALRHHTGYERQQVVHVAAAERDALNGRLRNDRSERGAVGLEQRHLTGHRNRFGDVANLQHDVDACRDIDLHGQVAANKLLEAGELHLQSISAGRHVRDGVGASAARGRGADLIRVQRDRADRGALHGSTTGIGHGADDGAENHLRAYGREGARPERQNQGCPDAATRGHAESHFAPPGGDRSSVPMATSDLE